MSDEQATVATGAGTCPECGWGMAADQRYCLNCGWRRGGPRVDYETQMTRNGRVTSNGAVTGPTQQWTPAFAILAIALLGVFLLLGVLIGKKGNSTTQTVAAAAPQTTTTAATPTNTTASTGGGANAKKGGGGAAAASEAGQGNVEKGGSGSTSGVQTANTNASALQNAKNGPTQVATPGSAPSTDNKPAGGGSGATCIGC